MNSPGFDKSEGELRKGLQALRRGDFDQSAELVGLISRIGSDRKALIPVLIEIIECSSGAVQVSAVEAIGRQGQGAIEAIDLLVRMLAKRVSSVSV